MNYLNLLLFDELFYVFTCSSSCKDEVIVAGEKLLLLLSGGKTEKTLDELRLVKFSQKVVTNKGAVQPEVLGQTSDAASFHSLRVYHQVQVWMGRMDIDPLDWGWMKKADFILPITMSKQAAPDELLKVIRCSCLTDCKGRCTCSKYNLKCTSMCKNCRGVSCFNCQHVDELVDDEVIEDRN